VHEQDDREVRFEVRGDSSGASITGDGTRLRTAFHSIFRAILREQPAAGVVIAERRLEKTGTLTSAVIVVADSEHVQAAYSAAAGPFDEKRGGLGLALPIARRVIEAHGGGITSPAEPGHADSIDGRGAAIITLPLRS
jgi:signal transduction histidine kinase